MVGLVDVRSDGVSVDDATSVRAYARWSTDGRRVEGGVTGAADRLPGKAVLEVSERVVAHAAVEAGPATGEGRFEMALPGGVDALQEGDWVRVRVGDVVACQEGCGTLSLVHNGRVRDTD